MQQRPPDLSEVATWGSWCEMLMRRTADGRDLPDPVVGT